MTETPHTQFGPRLRAERKARRLSQQTLADQLGVNRVTVNRWEVGHSIPNPLFVRRLEVALPGLELPGVPLDDIGARIAEARGRAGFTQAKLARLIESGRDTVASWEAGETRPRPRMIARLERVLEVKLVRGTCDRSLSDSDFYRREEGRRDAHQLVDELFDELPVEWARDCVVAMANRAGENYLDEEGQPLEAPRDRGVTLEDVPPAPGSDEEWNRERDQIDADRAHLREIVDAEREREERWATAPAIDA